MSAFSAVSGSEELFPNDFGGGLVFDAELIC